MESICEQIKKEVMKKISTQKNLDVFEIIEEEILKIREKVINDPDLTNYLKNIDTRYILDTYDNPNPILFKTYPSDRSHEIYSNSLFSKVPFAPNEIEKIRKVKPAIFGVGATGGYTALYFARMGCEEIALVDYDTFEPSNIGRQPFCYISTLGKKKVEVTKNFLEDINPSIRVEIYDEKITYRNLEKLNSYKYFHDAVDDVKIRSLIHKFGRKKGKICFSTGIEGFEGRYTCFFPTDPPWDYVWGESVIHRERGVYSLLPSLLAYLRVSDNLKSALNRGEIVRYPYFASINLFRKNPIVIRKFKKITNTF